MGLPNEPIWTPPTRSVNAPYWETWKPDLSRTGRPWRRLGARGAVASGSISLLSDERLRSRIASWPRLHADLRANEIAARNYARDLLWPAYASAGDVGHLVIDAVADLLPRADGAGSLSEGNGTMELRNSVYLRGIVAGRAWGSSGAVRVIDELIPEIDWILGQIAR